MDGADSVIKTYDYKYTQQMDSLRDIERIVKVRGNYNIPTLI